MQVNILEAKNQLSELVKAAAAGEDVVIASNGTPLVRLIPIQSQHGIRGWGSLKKYRAQIDAAFTTATEQKIARYFVTPE